MDEENVYGERFLRSDSARVGAETAAVPLAAIIPLFGAFACHGWEVSTREKGRLTMTNNDVLRRLRYSLNLNNAAIMEIFQLGEMEVKPGVLNSFLRKEEE